MKKLIHFLLFTMSNTVAFSQNATYIKSFLSDPDPSYSDQYNAFVWKNSMYFTQKGVLYKSDGTESGTIALIDSVSLNGTIAQTDSCLYLFVNSGKGYDLWKTKGTIASTTLLMNVPNSLGIEPGFIDIKSKSLYYTLNKTLWKTDGTIAGTTSFYTCNEYFWGLIEFKGKLLIMDYANDNYSILLSSDGTSAGTSIIKKFGSNIPYAYFVPSNMMVYQDKVYFLTNLANSQGNSALWVSDGTANGTTILNSLPAESNYNTDILDTLHQKLIFNFNTMLWTSDGIAENTLSSITREGAFINKLIPFKNQTFMITESSSSEDQVEQLNDDLSSTVIMTRDDLGSGVFILQHEVTKDNMYFATLNSIVVSNGIQGYFSSLTYNQLTGCTSCQVPLFMINYNDQLYFYMNNDAQTGLWRLDNTATGINDIDDLEQNLMVYPNPSNGIVKIECEGTFNLKLYDAQGLEITTQTFSNTAILQLTTGMYVTKISKGENVTTRKVVVK